MKWKYIGYSAKNKRNVKKVPKWVLSEAYKIHKYGTYHRKGFAFVYRIVVKPGKYGGRFYKFYRKLILHQRLTSSKFLIAGLLASFFLIPFSRVYSVTISQYFDILTLVFGSLLLAKGTWYLMKRIDRIDLRSDLNCWGLRLLGGILMAVGTLFILGGLTALFITALYTKTFFVYGNIIPVAGLCLWVLGIFSEFRSFRRYPIIYIET